VNGNKNAILKATLKTNSQGSLINASFDLKENLYGIILHLKVSMPLDGDDKYYGRELFKTSLNFERILNGIQESKMAKIFTDSITKSANIEPKFPLKKVCELDFAKH
jgi:hypothetical protein